MPKWYKVNVLVQPPLISSASGAIPFGLDAVPYRNFRGNKAIPETLVKGHLRENWELFYKSGEFKALINDLLGSRIEEEYEKEDNSGRLIFTPTFETKGDGQVLDSRASIRQDEQGVVQNKMLREVQYLDSDTLDNKTGRECPLCIEGYLLLLGKRVEGLNLFLENGLKLTPALGSGTNTGFGKVLDASVTECEPPSWVTPRKMPLQELPEPWVKQLSSGGQLGLKLVPCWPISFPKPGTGNILWTREYVPGAAIKAVIAQYAGDELKNSTTRQMLFDAMRVTNAHATDGETLVRPISPPLSMVVSKNDYFHDLLNCDCAVLLDGAAPTFLRDFKEEDAARILSTFGADANLNHHLNIRNEHDPSTRASKNKQLFSIESVWPKSDAHWLSNINIPKDTDLSAVEWLIRLLEKMQTDNAFSPLGKNKTLANIGLEPGGFEYAVGQGITSVEKGDQINLCLQSEANIIDYQDIQSGSNLVSLYRAYWEQTEFSSAFKLHRYISDEVLWGGPNWWHRFGKRLYKSQPYRPMVFTQPGSVFILEVDNPECASVLLEEWSNLGIPQLNNPAGGGNFASNPVIRENGYGEVAINLRSHKQYAPDQSKVEEVNYG